MIKSPSIPKAGNQDPTPIGQIYNKIVSRFQEEGFRLKGGTSGNAFDDSSINSQKILPSIRQDSPKRQKRKFYSNKVILNDSVYVSEHKQMSYHHMIEFKKLSIPLPFKEKEGVLSQRNRRIRELYERVQKNIESPENKIKFTSSINRDRELHSQLPHQVILKHPIKITVGERGINDGLRQAKERREKLQLPHLRAQRSKSTILKTEKLPQNPSVEGQTVKQTNQKRSRQKPYALLTQRNIQRIKQEDQEVAKQIKNERNRSVSERKMMSNKNREQARARVQGFNWKKQVLFLPKLDREAFSGLIRFYLELSNVQPILSGFYKAYVGPGNNCSIIKKTLKDRGHWIFVESMSEQPHFVWSQLRFRRFSQKLPPMQKDHKTIEYTSVAEIDKETSFQIMELLKYKNNDYFSACSKLLQPKVFEGLVREIMTKFKNNQNLKSFNQFRPQLVRRQQRVKIQLLGPPIISQEACLHNHIQNAGCVGNKKGLLYLMTRYSQLFGEDLNSMVPATVHLKEGEEYGKIFNQIPEGPWILKPGQATNRGTWITVHTNKESLVSELGKKKKHKNGGTFTNIVQRYVNPLLYFNRKFDIRVWVLWSGRKVWWYQEGYVRTASKEFTLKSTNKFIHLTNDAIQSQSEDYGKFEPANKASFSELNKYLESQYNYSSFYQTIIPEMKQLACKALRMANLTMDPNNARHSFELFGIDYLIDSSFKPWLIEFNTNPCLEVNCSLLARLIPNMLNNVMNLTADILFPAPRKKKAKDEGWSQEGFKFELLMDGCQDVEVREKMLLGKVRVEYEGQYQDEFIES